jgi:hypothetical protein
MIWIELQPVGKPAKNIVRLMVRPYHAGVSYRISLAKMFGFGEGVERVRVGYNEQSRQLAIFPDANGPVKIAHLVHVRMIQVSAPSGVFAGQRTERVDAALMPDGSVSINLPDWAMPGYVPKPGEYEGIDATAPETAFPRPASLDLSEQQEAFYEMLLEQDAVHGDSALPLWDNDKSAMLEAIRSLAARLELAGCEVTLKQGKYRLRTSEAA